MQFYPYGISHNDRTISYPINSFGEASSPVINLTESIAFYGETVRSVYVCNNCGARKCHICREFYHTVQMCMLYIVIEIMEVIPHRPIYRPFYKFM